MRQLMGHGLEALGGTHPLPQRDDAGEVVGRPVSRGDGGVVGHLETRRYHLGGEGVVDAGWTVSFQQRQCHLLDGRGTDQLALIEHRHHPEAVEPLGPGPALRRGSRLPLVAVVGGRRPAHHGGEDA